jgi:serine/threonine protein kinase
MERMEGLLFDALPELLASVVSKSNTPAKTKANANTTVLPLGAICQKLVTIFEAIHITGHIVLDVKPDNIMVTKKGAAAKKEQSSPDQIFAERIRLVDLGLVKRFTNAWGHIPNDGRGELEGTPMYASLNQHELQTAARRDDMEALLYVMGDMVLNLQGLTTKSKPPYGTGTKNESFLPWSQEQSDAAIGQKKRAMVEDPKSIYYSGMPANAARILFAALQTVREYAYMAKPKYDELKQLLADMSMPIVTNTTTPAKKGRPSAGGTVVARATPTRRSPRRPAAEVEDTTSAAAKDAGAVAASPAKRAKKNTKAAAAAVPDYDSDVVMIDIEEDDEEDDEENVDNRKPAAKPTTKASGKPKAPPRRKVAVAATAASRVPSPMEVDSDAKPKPARRNAPKTKTTAAAASATRAHNFQAVVKVTRGPLAGEEYVLAEGSERLVIGSAPTKKGARVIVPGPKNIATLELTILGKGKESTVAVKVTDLKSDEPVVVNGKRIPSGKDDMAFCNAADLAVAGNIFTICSA